jgi:hypothetical protein
VTREARDGKKGKKGGWRRQPSTGPPPTFLASVHRQDIMQDYIPCNTVTFSLTTLSFFTHSPSFTFIEHQSYLFSRTTTPTTTANTKKFSSSRSSTTRETTCIFLKRPTHGQQEPTKAQTTRSLPHQLHISDRHKLASKKFIFDDADGQMRRRPPTGLVALLHRTTRCILSI